MAMQASSIAIIDAGVMPCIRIIARIMVLHMSAQFMHAGAQSMSCVEHTVHACSQAAHASMQAWSTDMSIAAGSIVVASGAEVMFVRQASIIIESIAHRFRRRPQPGERAGRTTRLRPTVARDAAGVDGRILMSRARAVVNPVVGCGAPCEGGSPVDRTMKGRIMSADNDIKNNAEKLGGKIKEGVGKVTDNERLEAEGQADQTKASAKQAGENVKDAAHKAGESIRDGFKE
ncbi:CsbD family protein [Microbacterium sp. 1.5R]|uniref:CsbD family protein n=1 Tax=Microbacterium sp. 1.5R TaxID=1916917 RepID=UPI0021B48BC9|nr:CsbD family protein [Microbacterium sp. 1.5R]